MPMSSELRNIPAVNELLQHPLLVELIQLHGPQVVTRHLRQHLDLLRNQLLADSGQPATTSDAIVIEVIERVGKGELPSLRPVINATGILLHTGLGRAPLATEACEAIQQIARGYASVEVDLESGKRSQRVTAVESLILRLVGGEAAAVVNNNAGATVLALAALAANREVIVSRGQLVEIGGSFRMPDVMAASGAIMREVGTTNKTHLEDYRRAINDQTGALVRVHTSNYRIEGFSQSVSLEQLVSLAGEHGLPVIDDIGSGALYDYAEFGIGDEPLAARSLEAGADIVLFSGDKLLGGPQCGILVGRADLIKTISSHPLMRALRVDKITLAALAATLRIYQDPAAAAERIPLLRLLSTPLAVLQERAETLAGQLEGLDGLEAAEPQLDSTFLGGGSVPTQKIETWSVAISPAGCSVDELASLLRKGNPAIMGRVHQDRLVLDMRSVFPEQDELLAGILRQILSTAG
ncbi:MAG: L-seryl-tRNA(Sec) selenium transferase [Planctomycetaceae bacterium]|nr:L-seryl-tRNA(Sec) selenium transferase [Planctomycetaceae bacterium]